MKKRYWVMGIVGFLIIASSIYFFSEIRTESTISTIPGTVQNSQIEVIAQKLEIPWEIAILPNEDILITERPGRLVRLGKNRKVIPIEGVRHQGEGGLLGLALHPNFENNFLIYIYLTSNTNGDIENRVERYELNIEDNTLSNRQVILQGIPGARYHDGGKIAFGSDGYLYITTGDAGDPASSQDIRSLAGKILRITDTGNIPDDNPFGNEVYSYGHRNPQGITWDEQGRLWSTEHGRSGALSGYDELNLIKPGKNYGWKIIQGDEEQGDMETPVIHSGSKETWAPGGIVHYEGNLFYTGLRGASIYQYNIKEKRLTQHFKDTYGRLRAITLHEDSLFISTSNQDGRGRTNQGDDKIIKIPLQIFE